VFLGIKKISNPASMANGGFLRPVSITGAIETGSIRPHPDDPGPQPPD
jgi:hypothetical protein